MVNYGLYDTNTALPAREQITQTRERVSTLNEPCGVFSGPQTFLEYLNNLATLLQGILRDARFAAMVSAAQVFVRFRPS